MKMSKNVKVTAISCCVGCPFVSFEQDTHDPEWRKECCGWYDRLLDPESSRGYCEKPEWCKITEIAMKEGK